MSVDKFGVSLARCICSESKYIQTNSPPRQSAKGITSFAYRNTFHIEGTRNALAHSFRVAAVRADKRS